MSASDIIPDNPLEFSCMWERRPRRDLRLKIAARTPLPQRCFGL